MSGWRVTDERLAMDMAAEVGQRGTLLFKGDQNLIRFYRISRRHRNRLDCPRCLSRYFDFHLHGVKDKEQFVLLYLLSGIGMQACHYTSQGATAHLGLINTRGIARFGKRRKYR